MECEAFRDDQMDVLYGEADAATARRVSEHQAACPACREEMASLRRVRRDLTAWALPEGVVPRPAAARRPAAWLAAAAAVVAALGTAFVLSGSELRLDQGRVALRLGHGGADVEALLARQDSRHRAEMNALRAALLPASGAGEALPATGEARPATDEALLHRMEEMVRRSEERQDARFQARLAALSDEAETQRRYDLARVSAGLSYLEGRTGQDMVRTTELMGRVLQASQQK
jgi:hypothetical protein